MALPFSGQNDWAPGKQGSTSWVSALASLHGGIGELENVMTDVHLDGYL